MLSPLLKTISSYRVLVVGDAIIDEYRYMTPQWKSPKENLISYRLEGVETFKGGSWAAAAHVRNFCSHVDLYCRDAMIKRRSVEKESMRKLFEEHELKVEGAAHMPDPADYDLVIVTDFGHGCVTQSMIETLTRKAKFLAVNAQTNSANHGFNLITKYPRADYVVLDELEARLAAHDRDSLVEQVIEKLGYRNIIVTLGGRGCVGYQANEFRRYGAVSSIVLDTMGAGDAFFCVTAPFAAAGASLDELCKIGNAAGAAKCSVVGHRQAVTPAILATI